MGRLLSLACVILLLHPSASISMSTVPKSASKIVQRSFYKRALPDSCTSLSSRRGRDIFASALHNKGLKSFFPLIEQFTTQSEPAYCGISTLVMALNAFAVDPKQKWKGPWRWYEESMLNCCLDLEDVKETGITLKKFVCLAICQGIQADLTLAQNSSVETFREAIKSACHEDNEDSVEILQTVLIVSYSRKILGQTGSGHFSPIAAYDSASDMVLILDTARFKYGPHWVPIPLMFEAMLPQDPDTNKSRGYVLLSNHEESDHQPLPKSVLFHSRMNQFEHRLAFKSHLESLGHEPSWEETKSFWTKHDTDPSFVWKMIEAAFRPLDDREADMPEGVLNLLRELMADVVGPSKLQTTDTVEGDCVDGHCRPNYNRTVPIERLQATFLVYLACQSPQRREEMIARVRTDENAKYADQLLAETDLIQYAIQTSDQQRDARKFVVAPRT